MPKRKKRCVRVKGHYVHGYTRRVSKRQKRCKKRRR